VAGDKDRSVTQGAAKKHAVDEVLDTIEAFAPGGSAMRTHGRDISSGAILMEATGDCARPSRPSSCPSRAPWPHFAQETSVESSATWSLSVRKTALKIQKSSDANLSTLGVDLMLKEAQTIIPALGSGVPFESVAGSSSTVNRHQGQLPANAGAKKRPTRTSLGFLIQLPNQLPHQPNPWPALLPPSINIKASLQPARLSREGLIQTSLANGRRHWRKVMAVTVIP
jgi:hypothetical protein